MTIVRNTYFSAFGITLSVNYLFLALSKFKNQQLELSSAEIRCVFDDI